MDNFSGNSLSLHARTFLADVLLGRSPNPMTQDEMWMINNQIFLKNLDKHLNKNFNTSLMGVVAKFAHVADATDIVYLFARGRVQKRSVKELFDVLQDFEDMNVVATKSVVDNLFSEQYSKMPLAWILPLIAENANNTVSKTPEELSIAALRDGLRN